MLGTVHETGGGVYRIALDEGQFVDASLRGRVKREERTGDKVVIGDRVQVQELDGTFVVESVEPRRHQIVRRGPGGRGAKVVAANVDLLVTVMAARAPELRLEAIDRLLVIAEANGLRAVLVLNKVDLEDAALTAEPVAELYRSIGYPVYLVSAHSGAGLDELRAELCRGISAMVGPSGAGKSSLLNRIEPGLLLKTGGLSRRTERGRHTTVSARLIPLSCGGTVADTPGFGDVGVWGVEADEVAACFPDIRDRVHECRFRRCSHAHEPGCGVREALEAGELAQSRYQSFLTLRQEALGG